MNMILFLLLGFFWSLSFLGIKITIVSLSPLFAATLRVLIAQIVFTTLFLSMRQNLRVPFCALWRLWINGIFLQGIPFAALFFGETYLAPSLACIINSTVGLWTLVLSILLFKDYSQATVTKITGVIIALLGVITLCWPDLTHQHSKLIGIVAVTIMAISYALGALLNQRFNQCAHRTSLRASLWHQHWGSLVFLCILTTIFMQWPHTLAPLHNTQVIIALLYLGIFSTAAAWFIYVHLIHTWGSVRASSVLFLMPVLAIIWDRLFLHLVPATTEYLGVVIVLIGMAFIQFSKRKIGRKYQNVRLH